MRADAAGSCPARRRAASARRSPANTRATTERFPLGRTVLALAARVRRQVRGVESVAVPRRRRLDPEESTAPPARSARGRTPGAGWMRRGRGGAGSGLPKLFRQQPDPDELRPGAVRCGARRNLRRRGWRGSARTPGSAWHGRGRPTRASATEKARRPSGPGRREGGFLLGSPEKWEFWSPAVRLGVRQRSPEEAEVVLSRDHAAHDPCRPRFWQSPPHPARAGRTTSAVPQATDRTPPTRAAGLGPFHGGGPARSGALGHGL